MNIFITGGSGFIGTNLTRELLEDGHKVLIYDKRKSAIYPDLSIVGDVRDKDLLIKSSIGNDVIYHLAAEHRDDVSPISLYYDVNVEGAKRLVDAAKRNEINKLIFTSSAAVYGITGSEVTEKSSIQPFNDYGKSKYQAEKIFSEWARSDSARSLCIVRPTVIFGEKNRGNVYNLLNQLANGKFIMVGSGQNKKSMGYVLNLTSFLKFLLNSAPGQSVYNYADKPDLTVEELINFAFKTLGRNNRRYMRVPYSIGLMSGYVFDFLSRMTGKSYDISSIRIKKFCADTRISAEKLQQTGFSIPYSLKDGLLRMIKSEFL
jgi:GlcNAc-P-P-Und epimerase